MAEGSCPVCSLTFGRGRRVRVGNESLHPECARSRSASHCTFCGRALEGTYLVDDLGGAYCPRHATEYPKCRYCHKLFRSGDPPLHRPPDMIGTCPTCARSAVTDAQTALALGREPFEWITSSGLSLRAEAGRIRLTAHPTAAPTVQWTAADRCLGATRVSIQDSGPAEKKATVDVNELEYGLPATLFRGVLTHEWGHVWLYENGVFGLPPPEDEGFCQLLEWGYLSFEDSVLARHALRTMRDSDDPVYGAGFRTAKAVADALGFPALAQSLRQAKRYPVPRSLTGWDERT